MFGAERAQLIFIEVIIVDPTLSCRPGLGGDLLPVVVIGYRPLGRKLTATITL